MVALPSGAVKPKDPHCRWCMRRKVTEPVKFCVLHLAIHNERERQYRHRKKRERLCERCKQPAVFNQVRCAEHAQEHAIRCGIARYGHPSRRLTRWNPNAPNLVLDFVRRTNPYLQRDWETAKAFIFEHYYLWLPHTETTWRHRVYIEDYFSIYRFDDSRLVNDIRLKTPAGHSPTAA